MTDEVQSLSASVSGRLRLRTRPVFPDLRAQVPASHMPTQAELHSQTEASKPSNDQPSGQLFTPRNKRSYILTLLRKLILLYPSI